MRPALAIYAGQFESRADVKRVLGSSHRVATEVILTPPPELSLECPVLVLCGERDRLVPAGTAAAVAARFRYGSHPVLAGVGHCAHMESPELVAGLIEDFMGRVPENDARSAKRTPAPATTVTRCLPTSP